MIHLAIGLAIVSGKFGKPVQGEPPPEFVGWVFITIGAVAIVACWVFAAALAAAGELLQRRRGYTYCLVMAALACMFMPFGTVLGVFTLVVLVRPSVKELFAQGVDSTDQPNRPTEMS